MAKNLAKLLECSGGLEGKQARWISASNGGCRRWGSKRRKEIPWPPGALSTRRSAWCGWGRPSEAQQQAAAWPGAWRRRTQRLCPGGRASPLLNTIASHIRWNPVLWFCKFPPKFELKTKFHQNESCAKFYKLQIIFWWPRLNLSGKWWIWQNSLNFKFQFREIPIF